MKIIRFEFQNNSQYGLLEGESVQALEGDPFGPLKKSKTFELKKVRLLPPTLPSKIIGIGLNYTDHIKEMKYEQPKEPLVFLKPPSALNGPDHPIILPKMSQQVDYEGELAIVIGKICRHISEKEAPDFILGYSCFNDVTARDLQRQDVQFTRAKSFDSFACLGPWIETELEPSSLKLETKVNGEMKQSSNTRYLLFKPAYLISFLSQIMTLLPGDIITTGTPSGIGPLNPGDKVEVTIEGIGTLSNPVIQE